MSNDLTNPALHRQNILNNPYALQEMNVPEIYFGNIAKSPQLGMLDIRTFLNMAMLMVEIELFADEEIVASLLQHLDSSTVRATPYLIQKSNTLLMEKIPLYPVQDKYT